MSLIHASSPRCGGGSPLDTLAALMEVAAWSRPVGRFVPAAVVANGDAYFDARGPLRADWRAGDSVWSLVDGDALGRAFGPGPQSRRARRVGAVHD